MMTGYAWFGWINNSVVLVVWFTGYGLFVFKCVSCTLFVGVVIIGDGMFRFSLLCKFCYKCFVCALEIVEFDVLC